MQSKSFVLLFSFCWISGSAQQDSVSEGTTSRYWNMFLVGGVTGEGKSGTSFSVATVHGYRSASGHGVGAGVSYEDYGIAGWRTLPIYLSLALNFGRIGKGDLLLQADAGGMLRMWPLNRGNDWVSVKSKGGVIVHPALTYRLPLTEIDMYFKIGVKHQVIQYEERYNSWGWGPGSVSEFERSMTRVTFHFGFGLP